MHRFDRMTAAVLIALLVGCVGSATTQPPPGTTATTATTTGTTGTTPGQAAPQTASAPATKAGPPRKVTEVEGMTEYQLDNGLRVILFPDASQAKVTVNITYFVGSRHEGYGEAGMAHLLEHMVFKGTDKNPDIWKVLDQHGAAFNGTTWTDRTNYYETLAASDENLEFALALEADRMINSKIAPEVLAKEFSVVRNEFEMGENQPRVVLEERMMSAAYLWHNYGKSTIGNKSDIERVPADSLRSFYQRFYQPDNAMLVVAGRFEPDQALALVHKYYSPIPRPSRKLAPTYTVEPVQDGERTVILRRVGEVGVVGVLYHIMAGAHPDLVAADALTNILTDEPSGRLYKALVETGMATSVWGYVYSWAEPGTIMFFAEVAPGKPLEPVRDKMIEIVEGLGGATGKNAISDAEVGRYRSRELKNFELALANSQQIAIILSEWASLGDWRLLFMHRDRVAELKTDDVQKVARNYLKRDNRTLGMFIPTKTPERAPLPDTPDVLAMTKDYQGKSALSQGEVFEATIQNIESRTRRLTLPSGMKVAFLPKETRGDTVKLVLTLHHGSERELKGKIEAADLIPAMLMRGTRKRSYQEIRDELDRLKAQVSFGEGGFFGTGAAGSATARVTTTRDNLAAVVALLAEILQEPAFLPAEFEIVRKEELAALEESKADPMFLAFRRLSQQMAPWPKTDIRHVPTIDEQIARLKQVKLADLKSIHGNLWGASHAEIAVVGDFDPQEIEAALTKHFGAWKAKKAFTRIDMPFRPSQAGAEVIRTPDKQNAIVVVGHTVDIRDDDPDYAAVELAGFILAGSGTSRLIERLRQKEGLSYGAFGTIFASALDRHGQLLAAAICAPANAEKAQAYLLEEVKLLVDKGVTEKELADAKEAYLLQFKNQLASDDFVAAELGRGLYVGRTMEFQDKLNQAIARLTVADIQRALTTRIRPGDLFQVRAGDFAK